MDEPFTLIEERRSGAGALLDGPHLFNDVLRCESAPTADHDLVYINALREKFPEMITTACPERNTPLRTFAAAGFAESELDKDTDSFASWRGYVAPIRREGSGGIGEAVTFAKYHYKWKGEDFILYTVGAMQYILKERRPGEHALGPSGITDELIYTAGNWISNLKEVIWVYDGYWRQDGALFQEVQKASWDKVILDPSMKEELVSVATKFFDSKDIYADLGVPWKRGLLFHGPPGNGKTISIKALMHSLYQRKRPIPTLYVRSAPYTWDIGQVFSKARSLAPCMVILEDVETIVTASTRSYFFNEMDGLGNNDGLFIVASTNFLDKLDPGLSKRPSRFDRKYLFPLPNEEERVLYCDFWRQKLKSNNSVVFPKKLLKPMARVTIGFSFAFLQECFVATLLVIIGEDADLEETMRAYDSDNDDLDDYKLWRTFKRQAEILRKEVESQRSGSSEVPKNDGAMLEGVRDFSCPPPPQRADVARREHGQPSYSTQRRDLTFRTAAPDEFAPALRERKYETINSACFAKES